MMRHKFGKMQIGVILYYVQDEILSSRTKQHWGRIAEPFVMPDYSEIKRLGITWPRSIQVSVIHNLHHCHHKEEEEEEE